MKTKIVLDADVIIHFIKGGCLSLLFDIFPEYSYIILDVVYSELAANSSTKLQIDNTLNLLKNRFTKETFAPRGDSRMEYARLRSVLRLGRGESACMVYCRDNYDVLGSSNLRDIKAYCTENQITYLTTIDFLYYAFIRKKMTAAEISAFISDVQRQGSHLPDIDILTYIPTNVI
ncbi:MAG: hypothetical protein HDS65_10380 [Bacteroidales bacterium]|nr:hypothetical protein [Bacteroidales bacterium]